EIAALGAPADVVAFTDAAARSDEFKGARMILDMKPVPHILALSVNRKRLAFERLENGQRDEFLRKMERPIIVRTIRKNHGKSVGQVPGANEMIGACFRRRIRGRGRVGRVFGEYALVKR